jgi:hypothetical protein
MSDFFETWSLTRRRFVDAVSDLTAEQLNWRLHEEALSIGEMALHVAGTEVSFVSQLLGENPQGLEARLKEAATDSIVNDRPFPFRPEEITPDLVRESLEAARCKVEPLISAPSDDIRRTRIMSVLGPEIDGTGAFARLAYHPGYHQGQVHLVRTAGGFPR